MSYDLGSVIGQGGYGIVYNAVDEGGVACAVKKLNLSAFADAQVRQTVLKRFEREVKYQASIEHQNVAQIFYYDLEGDPPWFAMELAEGSLEDDLREDRTLGGDPKGVLFDILSGLEALHEKGFCHRDLKPANILKFRNGEDTVYKISDFGLTTPGAGVTTTLTQSNMAGGTPMYMAPECANNFRRATAQADIYSFGAILHDIFGGGATRTPFSEIELAGPLGPIVKKCAQTNVHRRYRSIAALREALFNILAEEEIAFESQEEEDVIGVLRDNDELGDSQWDRVFNLIDDNADKGKSNRQIFMALLGAHIEQLFDIAPDMAHGLGEIFSEYAMAHSFDFEYCDVISDKAQIFFDQGDLQLKAKIAVAMLELGTSHNRWRVEHQFVRMAGVEISEDLANRIRIEIEVQGIDFTRKFDHLVSSIGAEQDDLHEELIGLLEL